MSDTIKWEIEIFWDSAFIDGQYLVLKDNFWSAKNWDEVEIENISDNPNIPIYRVVWLVWETKEKVVNLIEWTYREWKKGGGFINTKWSNNQIFVNKINTSWAKTWDKVFFILWNQNWREEWLIKEIIEASETFSTAELIKRDNKIYFIDDKTNKKIYIDEFLNGNNFDFNLWDIYRIQILKDNKFKIEERLWVKWDFSVEIAKIAVSNWIRLEFPENVLRDLSEIDNDVESDIEKRKDLRNLLTITIDGADSKDLDDAISIEVLKDWKFKLYVHIADVTHYIKEWSDLDKEAFERGTSYYYADRVTPMYPEKISNDLCSLNPHTDKQTVTVEIVCDKYWKPILEECDFYESVINTDFRMTYKEIDEIDNWKINIWDRLLFKDNITKELSILTKNAFDLSTKIWKQFKEKGELEINSTETKIIVDEEKRPIGIWSYPKYESNNLIKNMMVMANYIVPQLVWNKLKGKFEDVPFIHRTHLEPEEESVEKLKNILQVLNINFQIENNKPETFSKLLESIKWHSKERFLTKKITTTLKKAIYTSVRQGHFGLALDYYSHFTSPIRRYSDTQIHRIMKEILHWDFTSKRYEHYNNMLESVAEKCSLQEVVSETNEKDVNKFLSVQLMKDKIWESFVWYIDDINTKKVNIILDNTIWGVVSEVYLSDYYFEKLFEWVYRMKNNNDWTIIELWDKVNLVLESVNEWNLDINFKIEK